MEHLASAEFSGATDVWQETLCLEVKPEGGSTLSSYAYSIVADVADFPCYGEGQPRIPEMLNGERVWRDGDFVVSEHLIPRSDGSVAEFARGEADQAIEWLTSYGWARVREWEHIRRRVREALS
jgi:hypothetical protein